MSEEIIIKEFVITGEFRFSTQSELCGFKENLTHAFKFYANTIKISTKETEPDRLPDVGKMMELEETETQISACKSLMLAWTDKIRQIEELRDKEQDFVYRFFSETSVACRDILNEVLTILKS